MVLPNKYPQPRKERPIPASAILGGFLVLNMLPSTGQRQRLCVGAGAGAGAGGFWLASCEREAF